MDSEYLQFVSIVIDALEQCEARYAIGGSFASMFYGEIRYTYDIDISMQISAAKISAFIKYFQNLEWYVFPEGVEKAVQQGGDFQVIDGEHGLKADFYVTAPVLTPRQQRTLDRARKLEIGTGDKSVYFMSPEDVILYKLEWYMMGKAEKHILDIGKMFGHEISIDYNYINRWVDEVNAREIWENLLKEFNDKKRNADDNTSED